VNADPERQGDACEPRRIRTAADLMAHLGMAPELAAELKRALERENLVLGGLLLGRGATLYGKPIVWDLHWPEGMPPGFDEAELRKTGAQMVRTAGGDPAPGPERPVAGALREALALIHRALILRMYGDPLPCQPDDDPEAGTWAQWDRRAEEFMRAQTALAEQAKGKTPAPGPGGEE
jgi:hypothetical protein